MVAPESDIGNALDELDRISDSASPNPFTREAVLAIVEEAKLQGIEDELESALANAHSQYLLALGVRTMQEDGRRWAGKFAELAMRLQTIKQKWDALGQDAHESFSEFAFPRSGTVDAQLEELIADLSEYSIHWKRREGNPGLAHIGTNVDVEPLKTFASALKDFWQGANLGPFSHVLDPEHREHAKICPDTPKSPALRLLFACARRLNPQYGVRQCASAIRSVDKRMF